MPVDRPTSPRKPHHLERLLEVSRTLSSTLDVPQLLQTVVDSAADLTQSEAASILLYDPAAGELRFEAASGAAQGALSTLSIPIDSSVAGWVFTHTRPMVVQDASADPRVYRRVDSTLQFKTRSILGVPLLVKREAIGVIEAVNKHPTRNYTEDDLAILETLAAQAAIAIENARLLTKLQDANAELTRLDRMKSDFIAIASHELRTPLGLILGHATFLKEIIPADYQEQMEVIVRSAMRLKSIIEDMSTISHKEEGQSRVRRAQFSLSKLAQDMVGRFEGAAAEKQIEIGCDVPSQDSVVVSGDRDKIEVALSNLIRNALAFTDQGGQIGVKVESEGGYARVFVVDTGIGIPASEIDRVFERFYQVESHLTRKHGGMGLGLSIAKAMVEMHGGQIWCESKEGMGSLFCFMVPIDEKQAAAAAKVFRTA